MIGDCSRVPALCSKSQTTWGAKSDRHNWSPGFSRLQHERDFRRWSCCIMLRPRWHLIEYRLSALAHVIRYKSWRGGLGFRAWFRDTRHSSPVSGELRSLAQATVSHGDNYGWRAARDGRPQQLARNWPDWTISGELVNAEGERQVFGEAFSTIEQSRASGAAGTEGFREGRACGTALGTGAKQ